MDLFSTLEQHTDLQGFPLWGAVDYPHPITERLYQEGVHRFESWLKTKQEGSMHYLARGAQRRRDPKLVFPSIQSVLVLAKPYSPLPMHGSLHEGPRFARYLRGTDYHEEFKGRIDSLMSSIGKAWNAENSNPLEWKVCVDTSAVLEKSWAVLTGLGWIGKNSLFLHPKFGSYLFLGVVFLNQRVHRGPKLHPNFCGNCNRCQTACPTEALQTPQQLETKKCISYWTLEHRGAIELLEADKLKFKSWIAGCDICQEVCPFNLKITAQSKSEDIPKDFLLHWKQLIQESSDQYKNRIQTLAINRIKPGDFSRNLAIAFRSFVHDEKSSLTQSTLKELLDLLEDRLVRETDSVSRSEWVESRNILLTQLKGI